MILRLLILFFLLVLTSSQDGFHTGGIPDEDPWYLSRQQATTKVFDPATIRDSILPPERPAVQPPEKITRTLLVEETIIENNNTIINVDIDNIGSTIQSSSKRRLAESKSIIGASGYTLDPTLKIFYDPPLNSSHPHALGLYVWCNNKDAKIYYNLDALGTLSDITFDNEYVNFDAPYIHISTPYQSKRERIVRLIAVVANGASGGTRSSMLTLPYYVEGSDRPDSFAFFVPGVNSDGYFLKVAIENKSAARAQSAGSQEFADFYAQDGVGTYNATVTATAQVSYLRLLDIDSDLTGFEGGIPYNTSDGRYYGVLVPWHNGKDWHGKVVRINLRTMDGDRDVSRTSPLYNNVTGTFDFTAALKACKGSYRKEYYDPPYSNNLKVFPPNAPSEKSACITVLDLSTYTKNARGFIRGFTNYPYIYLSPGRFNIPVRLHMETFSLSTTRFLNVTDNVVMGFGGYSGGFSDSTWACFSPHRTYVGFVGGFRSSKAVDEFHTTSFMHGVMACFNDSAWNQKVINASQVRLVDFSKINNVLRGYSDAIRVGRYAYFAPLATAEHTFSPRVTRLYLGTTNIANCLDDLKASGKLISSIVDILDVSQKDKSLVGFLGIFNQGKYIFLVPYRNSYAPINGQRGHGNIVRVDLNIYDMDGVVFLDASVAQRAQIPSVQDEDLRGFSYGFASGKYALFTPFYNGIFTGKICRVISYSLLDTARTTITNPEPLSSNVQELNLALNGGQYADKSTWGKFVGFRGGFGSIWQGADVVKTST